MLNLNTSSSTSRPASPHHSSPSSPSGSSDTFWKVLVYDKYCQGILAPLVTTDDLRRQGITLHMLLERQRQRVPDAPAVYFVRPTQGNVDAIARDFARGLYDELHVNFSSSVSDALLQRLAGKVAEAAASAGSGVGGVQAQSHAAPSAGGPQSQVRRVFDQYCEFVSLEPSLLSLNHTDSYVRLNDPRAAEEELMGYVDEVVESLFSIIVTMGVVPIIRCPPGEAAQLAATKLDDKLRKHLTNPNHLFQAKLSSSSFQRPVLVLVDRNVDLTVPLHHPCTYQALVHDLLGMKGNRVVVEDQGENKTFDLDASDEFWSANQGSPFPTVAAAIEENLKEYRAALDRINQSSAGASSSEAAVASMGNNTDSLYHAINSIPVLQRKKRLLDMHTHIATAILAELKARQLDAFFALEEPCISRAHVERKDVLAHLGREHKGSFMDKLRLFLIYYLSQDRVAEGELEEMQAALLDLTNDTAPDGADDDGADAEPAASLAVGVPSREEAERLIKTSLAYLKQFKFTHSLTVSGSGPASASSSSAASTASAGSALFGRLADSVRSTGLLDNVRNLLPVNSALPLTRIVEAVMDCRDSSVTENYLYFDPKVKQAGGRGGPIRRAELRQTQPFTEGLVFVLGSGNYVEFQALREYAETSSRPQAQRSITYASTEIASPEEFVRQLCALGGGVRG